MINCIKNIFKEGFIFIIVIILYSILLSILKIPKKHDPLIIIRTKYFGNLLNGWTISHFLLHLYFGYKYPHCFKEALTLGILWELFEFSFGELFPILFPSLANKIDPHWSSWYYGCYEDVIMNTIGFLIGRFIRLKIKN